MSAGRSTARRYRAESGPVLFGIPGLDVRWNRESQTIVIECDDGSGASWSETGETACLLIVALASAHRKGRLRETMRDMFDGVRMTLAMQGEFYRVGRLMCWRPSWQEAA